MQPQNSLSWVDTSHSDDFMSEQQDQEDDSDHLMSVLSLMPVFLALQMTALMAAQNPTAGAIMKAVLYGHDSFKENDRMHILSGI